VTNHVTPEHPNPGLI